MPTTQKTDATMNRLYSSLAMFGMATILVGLILLATRPEWSDPRTAVIHNVECDRLRFDCDTYVRDGDGRVYRRDGEWGKIGDTLLVEVHRSEPTWR